MPKAKTTPNSNTAGLKVADLYALRELQGLPMSEFLSTIGNPDQKRIQRNQFDAPLYNNSLELIVLFFTEFPDEFRRQHVPSTLEMFEKVRPYFEAEANFGEYTWSRFALLFGKKASSGYRWATPGVRVSKFIQKLFVLLDRLITERGETGWKMYLSVVDKQAKFEGFAGAADKIIRYGKHSKA
jgi:hypothetical protein